MYLEGFVLDAVPRFDELVCVLRMLSEHGDASGGDFTCGLMCSA